MRRGFTLVEALGSMFVMSLLLGCIGLLMESYSSVSRRSTAKDQAVVGANLALSHLRDELSSAVTMSHPATSAPDTILQFQRVDPNYQSATSLDRMPSPLTPPLPASFDPYDPSYLVDVRYLLQGDRLMRLVTSASGISSQMEVASGLAGFSGQRQAEADPTGVGGVVVIAVYGQPVPSSVQIEARLNCLSRLP
jgi:type II secretory pathway pseudopilin PulG